MNSDYAYSSKKVNRLVPLFDTVLVSEMAFEERISQGGIIIPDDDMKNWHKSHMSITKKFVTDAAEILAKDPEYRKMILRKLQEAIPMKSLTEGTEDMQIDGMYITQDHMFELFGTKDWNKIKEFLDVQVINGVGTLVYKAKSEKQQKPIPIALIGIREKGGGYDGNPALEVKPSKDFEELMGTISDKLNKA